jgi:hypothetical protein
MWEILIFKVISAPENSNKFQKTRFWKEKSIEDMVTLGPMTHATLVYIIITLLVHAYLLLNQTTSLHS